VGGRCGQVRPGVTQLVKALAHRPAPGGAEGQPDGFGGAGVGRVGVEEAAAVATGTAAGWSRSWWARVRRRRAVVSRRVVGSHTRMGVVIAVAAVSRA
jgi:hypothetical protein